MSDKEKRRREKWRPNFKSYALYNSTIQLHTLYNGLLIKTYWFMHAHRLCVHMNDDGKTINKPLRLKCIIANFQMAHVIALSFIYVVKSQGFLDFFCRYIRCYLYNCFLGNRFCMLFLNYIIRRSILLFLFSVQFAWCNYFLR